jgi:membrane-associated phospholipid phosphatase
MGLFIGRSNVEHVLSRRTRALCAGATAGAIAAIATATPVRAQGVAPTLPTGQSPSLAAPSAAPPLPWDSLGDDVADAFSGANLLFYGAAVAVTGEMAFSGGDQGVRVAVQSNFVAPAFADGANYAGYLLPAIVPPVVYVVGLAAGDRQAAAAGCAALQALGIELLVTSVVKIGVGRPYPLNGGDPNAPSRLDHPEYAREFRPFGSGWPVPAWPSGHTSATTAVAAALAASYPDRLWVAVVGYSLALAVGVGLVVGDRHWTSDVVAGALVGHAIGYSVGSAFRRRTQGDGGAGAGLQLVPLLGPGLLGAAVGRAW